VRERSPARTGELIRHWRHARRMSQSELAARAQTSARNLSFIENDRSKPSESLLERLAEALEIPDKERHLLFRSAHVGRAYAPMDLDSPEMSELRDVLHRTLQRFDPYPAVLMDRTFRHLASNESTVRMLLWLGVDLAKFRDRSINMVELLLDPTALGAHLTNWREIGRHAIQRLYRDAVLEDPDGQLAAQLERLLAIEGVPDEWRIPTEGPSDPLARFRFEKDGHELELDSLIMTIGTPMDVSFQEVRLRYFLPADAATEALMIELAGGEESAFRRLFPSPG